MKQIVLLFVMALLLIPVSVSAEKSLETLRNKRATAAEAIESEYAEQEIVLLQKYKAENISLTRTSLRLFPALGQEIGALLMTLPAHRQAA